MSMTLFHAHCTLHVTAHLIHGPRALFKWLACVGHAHDLRGIPET